MVQDYLAIGNHVQFSLQCSQAHEPRALSSTYTRTEVHTIHIVHIFKFGEDLNEYTEITRERYTGKKPSNGKGWFAYVYDARGRMRKTKGWFLTASVAPPRQKAAEERNFSPKARVRAREFARPTEVRRSKDDEATGVKRTGTQKGRWW